MSRKISRAVKARCKELIKHIKANPTIFHDNIDPDSLYVSVNFKETPGLQTPPQEPGGGNEPPFQSHCCGPRGCGPLNCP